MKQTGTDLGARLRGARISRRLSLGDIARTTKISTQCLHAMERNEFGRLPGGVFRTTYIRAFAAEVGLDAEELVREYRAIACPPTLVAAWRSAAWRWGAPLALFLVLIAPFVSILIAPEGRALGDPTGDGPMAYLHYGAFLGESWRNGQVPLWNPHIMLGIPFVGEGQASAFHPLTLLYAVLAPGVAMNWIIAIAFVATGACFYGYLRALRLGRPAAWFGAVVWSFSSAMIARIVAGHINILLTFISMPMALMFWERYRAGREWRQLAGVSLAYGLMVLASYPQLLYSFSWFLIVYVAIRGVVEISTRSSTVREQLHLALALGGALMVGAGVGAVQLLPSLDFFFRSFRVDVSEAFAGTFSFAPEYLLTLIAPQFFGTSVSATDATRYWGRNLPWEMSLYIGILPLLLAVAGVWTARRERWPLVVCAAVFLAVGLGSHTALFGILYEHLPLFDLFRGSSKNTLITLWCLVVLSAFGFDALFGSGDAASSRRPRRAASAAAVTLFAAVAILSVVLLGGAVRPESNWARFVAWVWSSGEILVQPLTADVGVALQTTSRHATESLVRAMVLLAAGLGLLVFKWPVRLRVLAVVLSLGLVLVDLWSVFLPKMVTFDRSSLRRALQLDGLTAPYPPRILVPHNNVPNVAIRSGYSTPFGYTGNTLRRYNAFMSRLQHLDPRESRAVSLPGSITSEYDVLGVDAVALRGPVPQGARRVGTLGNRVLVDVTEKPGQGARVFLAESPRYVTDAEQALSYALAPDADVEARPVIERAHLRLVPRPIDARSFVRVVSYEPNRVELDVRTSGPREVVFREMFERNWKATVNGKPATVSPANYVFRAVQVPAGRSQVVLEYRPWSFYLGAVISGLSIVGLVVMVAARRRAALGITLGVQQKIDAHQDANYDQQHGN